MKYLSTLPSLVIVHSVARAAPASPHTQPSTAPIATPCSEFEYRQEWLIAECLTGQDSTTTIQSAVYLRNKLGNNDGSLQWEVEGNYARSCDDCKLLNGGGVLTCSCATAWGTNKPPKITSTLNLDEHISVYNGHLLSNLTAPPTPPATSSIYPIPTDFHYSWGGLTTCPEAGNESYDFCRRNVNACTTSNATDERESWFRQDGPLNCWVPYLYFPDYHFQFEAIKFVSVGAWEMLGYADEACTGEPIQRIGYEDRGVCRVFGGERVRAVTVRPLFNGDPR